MADILEECLKGSSIEGEDETDVLLRASKGNTTVKKKVESTYHMKGGKKRIRERIPKKEHAKTQKITTAQDKHDSTLMSDHEHDDFSDEITDLQSVLLNCDEDSNPKNTNWFRRTTQAESSWVDARSSILASLVKRESADFSLCLYCGKNPSCIQCFDCSPAKDLCFECDRKLHVTNAFHNRTIFKDCFTPLAPTQTYLNGEIRNIDKMVPLVFPKCNCENSVMKIDISRELVAVIRTNGRFDLNKYIVRCSCGNSYDPFCLANLLASGYWPGSLKQINCIFHESCFVMWDRFSKRMPGSSVSSYVKSLEDISRLHSLTDVISCTLFTRTYKEWKYGQHELDKLMTVPIFSCPACDQQQHSCHVDGNNKLYRYKTSGKRTGDSYYRDLFISSNDKVGKHLESLDYSKQKSKNLQKVTCGSSILKAAQDISRRKAALDETGLEYCVCRHGIALKAVNMFRGEIFGYAHYLQTTFMLSQNVEFFWYDVVCKYWPWLHSHDPFAADQMKPALSVMHGKIHQMSCQVQWSGRWQNGSAKSSGEEAEQVNSYLSRVGNTTKYMLPQNREDSITEFASDWNCRKVAGLAKSLIKRFRKNSKDIEISKIVWENSCVSAGIHTSVGTMTKLTSEVVRFFTVSEENLNILSPKETCALYSLRLKQLDSDVDSSVQVIPLHYLPKCGSLRSIIQSKLRILVSKLKQINPSFNPDSNNIQEQLIRKLMNVIKEKVLNHQFQARIKRLSMSKLTDTSKQRIRMRRTIDTLRKKIALECKEYNELAKLLKDEELDLNNDSLPLGGTIWGKKTIIDEFHEWQRCVEEKKLLLREMENYVDYYATLKNSLKAKLKNIVELNIEENQLDVDEVNERYDSRGMRALYSRSVALFEKLLHDASDLFSTVSGTSVKDPASNIDSSDSEDELQISDDDVDSEDERYDNDTDEHFFVALEQA